MEDRLILRVNLSEIAQVPPWIERLAMRYVIPKDVQFACNLCLEEVLSNIILHGYDWAAEGEIVVRFAMPSEGRFLFTVEDEAPHFDPLDRAELPALNPNEEMWIGGQGLRLLRKFAGALEYERLPGGNRYKMFFPAASRQK